MTAARPIEDPAATPDLGTFDDVFAIEGDLMMAHNGRSVVRLMIDDRTYYLKRYWFVPTRFFKRYVRLGLHELAMIDWLDASGFSGPKVVARGSSGILGIPTRLYFLMAEVEGELPLERYWRRNKDEAAELFGQLARYAARLHEAGFCHTDFSERHILVGRNDEQYTYRLIDVERASLTGPNPAKAAADLKTLAASVADDGLREYLSSDFLTAYLSARKNPLQDFRALFEKAKPTKSFE